MKIAKKITFLLISLSFVFLPIIEAQAEQTCIRAVLKNGKVRLRKVMASSSSTCPRGYQSIVDTATLAPGPQGEQGPQGAQGVPGEPGATSVVVRIAEKVSSFTNDSLSVSCAAGERAVSGGGRVKFGNISGVLYFEQGGFPTTGGAYSENGEIPDGWTLSWYNPSSHSNTFEVYAVCAMP